MKIRCPSCSNSFDVDPSEAKAGSTVTCPQCSHSFAAAEADDNAGVQLQGEGSRKTGSERFFVKRPTGKVFGPFDKNALQMMLKAGKLGGDAELSTDKQDWKTLAEMPDFAKYAKVDVPEGNPNGTVMGGWNTSEVFGEGDGSNLPKSQDGGGNLPRSKDDGGNLPRSKGDGSNLPKSKGGGPPDLPKPKKKKGGGPPDLPKPKSRGGSDLPRSKERGSGLPKPTSSGSDLPRSAESNLPRSSQDNLPRDAGDNLPRSSQDNLPRDAGDNLPRSSQDNLPRDAGDNLPRSQQDNMPRSQQDNMPRSQQDNVPRSAQGGGNLPRSTAHLSQSDEQAGFEEEEEDLFAAPGTGNIDSEAAEQAGSLFGEASEEEDDLFAAPAGQSEAEDDLFGGPEPADEDEDDLFAAPEPQDDEDDLFGAPDQEDEDDLFGGPADEEEDELFGGDDGGQVQGNQTPMDEEEDLFGGGGGSDEDDLFGAAPGEDEEDEDDLFAASANDEAMFGDDEDEDDFLGGDDGFSFLDDEEPEPEDEDDWGQDLMGNQPPESGSMGAESAEDWGDDMLDDSSQDQGGGDDFDSQYEDDDPFRPASPGVRQPASTGAPAQTTKDEAVEEDKKRGLMTLVGVPVLALLVIGGVGYAVYTAFFDTDETTGEQKVVEKGPVEINLSAVDTGNYAALQQMIDEGREGKLDKTNKAKLLLTESIFLSRYDDPEVASHADELAEQFKDATEGWPAVGRGAWEAQAGNADAARTYLEPLVDGETGYYAQLMMGVGDVKAIEKMVAPAESEASGESAPEANEAASQEGSESGEAPANGEQPEDKEQAGDEAASEKKAGGEEATDDEAEGDAEEPSGDERQEVAGADAADQTSGDGDVESEAPADQAEQEAIPAAAKTMASRARTTLDRASTSDARAEPYYWKGRLESMLGEEATALSVWKAGAKAQPDHVATQLALARAQYDQGELNAAASHLEKITKELGPDASTSEQAEAWHYQGMLHVARRKSDEAINAFTKALSIDASRTDTLRALAEEYERAEKYKEALNFFTTNKSLGQKDPDVMLGIVRSHMGLEQWNEAIGQLEKGEKLFPKDARFPYYLGQLNLRRGAFFDAQKSLERAVEIDPTLLLAQAKLAQLAWKVEEDIKKGEGHVDKINKRPDLLTAEVAHEVAKYYSESGRRQVAEQWFRAALEQDTNYWPARLALARVLLERGENEKALALLERAREEGVEDVRLSAYLADAYRQSEKYDRAVDQINRVIDEYPKNEEYIFIRGRIYFDRGNYDTARQDFNKAYELNPRYHRAYFYVGRTAFEQNDYDTATRIFRHVLDYRPNNGEFHYWMGRAYERENRNGQALEEYRKASAVDEAYAIRNPELFIRRGRLLARLGYSIEGRKDIERALELAPEMDEALIAMGETNFDDKMYDEAIENFSKALEKAPERGAAQYKLGMALIYSGKDNAGIKHLQKAVQYGYDDPEVFRTLGYKYKELGKRRLAINAFKEFLKTSSKKEDIPPQTKREMIDQINEMGGSL